MKLLVKNLGPIRGNTQTIDLSKRFYIFVGQNNSGKTYVSQLLWTIFNKNVINKFCNEVEIKFNEETSIEITDELLSKILVKYADFLKQELVKNTFNIKTASILEKVDLSFSWDLEEIKQQEWNLDFNLSVGKERKVEYIVGRKDKNSLSINFTTKTLPEEISKIVPNISSEVQGKPEWKTLLVASIIFILLKHDPHTFFLPASRSFYSTFYQYIYDIDRRKREEAMTRLLDIIEENDRKGTQVDINSVEKLNLFKRPYTAPMNHVLEQIFSLNKEANIIPHYKNIVEQLAKIMGGDIVLKSLEGIAPVEFFFNFGEEGRDLPMYLASSSANQLTLLYLYFKYWVGEDKNFLIMDEPEENLHPANQIALLELLIKFATQNDNKMLITTHSPLMANAINNYIYLDTLKNELKYDVDRIVKEHNLKLVSTDVSISKDDVGVYFFNGKRIIDYDTEYYGAYFRDFQEIINAQEESTRILSDYIYLQESEDE
jgi:predicted ATPase